VAVLGWGQGGTGPQILPRPPKFLIGFRVVLGVYRRTRAYAVYQPLVFLTAYNDHIFIIKLYGDIRLNSEQENVHCTVPRRTAEKPEFLSL